MEQKTKFNIWYVLAAIWGVLILQNVIFDQFRPQVIPYSEFIAAVESDKVIEIAVGQDRISGKMRGETANEEFLFTTVRVDNDLSQKLTDAPPRPTRMYPVDTSPLILKTTGRKAIINPAMP